MINMLNTFLIAHMVCKLYEDALLQDPANKEKLMSSLFMAYASNCEYKKQQYTALTLHKAKPNNPFYYFWTVMSIVMQVCSMLSLQIFLASYV